MKVTPYGFLVFIAVLIGFSFIKPGFNIFIVILISIVSQSFLCNTCSETYSLASYLSILPLLSAVIFNCGDLKGVLIGFSLGCAIGRIGCYFAGCCTGKELNEKTWYAIEYKKGSLPCKKKNKDTVYVYPTIFFEIIVQFIIALSVYYSDYGIYTFGIGYIILYILTNMWRDEKRMDIKNNKQNMIPVIGLTLYTIYVFIKCKPSSIKPVFKFYWIYVIISLLTGVIVSNDLNMNSIKKILNL